VDGRKVTVRLRGWKPMSTVAEAAGDVSRVRRRADVATSERADNSSYPLGVPRKTGRILRERWPSSGIGGREITREDILYICSLIERHPNDSRRKLSTRLCESLAVAPSQWRVA